MTCCMKPAVTSSITAIKHHTSSSTITIVHHSSHVDQARFSSTRVGLAASMEPGFAFGAAFEGLDAEAHFWENTDFMNFDYDPEPNLVDMYYQEFHGANAVDIYREERRLYVVSAYDSYDDTSGLIIFSERILQTVDHHYELLYETLSLFNVSDYGREGMAYPDDLMALMYDELLFLQELE